MQTLFAKERLNVYPIFLRWLDFSPDMINDQVQKGKDTSSMMAESFDCVTIFYGEIVGLDKLISDYNEADEVCRRALRYLLHSAHHDYQILKNYNTLKSMGSRYFVTLRMCLRSWTLSIFSTRCLTRTLGNIGWLGIKNEVFYTLMGPTGVQPTNHGGWDHDGVWDAAQDW